MTTTGDCDHSDLITTPRAHVCRQCGQARTLPRGEWRSQRRFWPAWAIEIRWGGPVIDVCPNDGATMDVTYDDRRRCPLCGLVWRRPTHLP